ncbi:hypothetical protein [Streptomyces sp. NPDC090025]|uniref:hypothetical protein n=1 Tax=Streptomyces sp. NPDC090025 TaxID=3365922 RepID=UPI00383307FB
MLVEPRFERASRAPYRDARHVRYGANLDVEQVLQLDKVGGGTTGTPADTALAGVTVPPRRSTISLLGTQSSLW